MVKNNDIITVSLHKLTKEISFATILKFVIQLTTPQINDG